MAFYLALIALVLAVIRFLCKARPSAGTYRTVSSIGIRNISLSPFHKVGHSFGQSSMRQKPILEGDIPLESPKCPLKSDKI